MTMLLCRTGWLDHYKGLDGDEASGGHRWLKEGKTPYEFRNFLPTSDGRLLGYVQVKGKININRLGASRGDGDISGLTVVWCAQHPDGRGLVVTGWYLNATVYREMQRGPEGWDLACVKWHFRIEGQAAESQLIDASLRNFIVQAAGTPPKGRVFGMADLAYVEGRLPHLVAGLRAYIHSQS